MLPSFAAASVNVVLSQTRVAWSRNRITRFVMIELDTDKAPPPLKALSVNLTVRLLTEFSARWVVAMPTNPRVRSWGSTCTNCIVRLPGTLDTTTFPDATRSSPLVPARVFPVRVRLVPATAPLFVTVSQNTVDPYCNSRATVASTKVIDRLVREAPTTP